MLRPIQTAKEISMNRQIFISVVGVKAREIIGKIS